MILYKKVSTEKVECEYGWTHDLQHWIGKHVEADGTTYLMDNGYEKRQMPVYEDRAGTKYRKYQTIDYWSNTSYRAEDDDWWYASFPAVGTVLDSVDTPLDDRLW